MGFLKKNQTLLIASLVVVVIYFITRLITILAVPIFTDEAIYMRWAQIALHDSNWRFISLTDGKQPLYIWITMIAMHFIHDPLLAGRLVSVGAGLVTIIGLFLLTREVFKNYWIAFLASFLYVAFPFSLVYDRMALYDGLVGTFAVWGLYLVIVMVRTLRLDSALILGMTAGLGVLNKTNGFFTIYLLPFALLLFDWTKKERLGRLGRLGGYAVVVVVIAYGYYAILRLSPFFHIIADKNATFVYPLHEWLMHPFSNFFGNLWFGETEWLFQYMTWPWVLLVVASFFVSKKFTREKLLLLIWFAVEFIGEALFGRIIYPRYIFPMTLSLLPLVAYALYSVAQRFKKNYLGIGIVVLAFFLPVYSDYFILFDFSHAPIPAQDLEQYIRSWPAGGGVKEAVAYFGEKAKTEKITIGTEGTFGLMPYAFELYLVQSPNVKIEGIWPIKDTPPADLIEAAKTHPTYVVFYQPCPSCPGFGEGPKSWNMREVLSVQKGPGAKLTVYQLQVP